MKVNILNNSHETYEDFLNIDPYAQPGDNKKKGNLLNLDEHVDDGEASYILAKFILEFMDRNAASLALDNWVKKLGFGGRLDLCGYDSHAVAREYTMRGIPEEEFNKILYGDTSTPWNRKTQVLNLKWVLDELKKRGLLIEKACVQDLKYHIIGKRNGN